MKSMMESAPSAAAGHPHLLRGDGRGTYDRGEERGHEAEWHQEHEEQGRGDHHRHRGSRWGFLSLPKRRCGRRSLHSQPQTLFVTFRLHICRLSFRCHFPSLARRPAAQILHNYYACFKLPKAPSFRGNRGTVPRLMATSAALLTARVAVRPGAFAAVVARRWLSPWASHANSATATMEKIAKALARSDLGVRGFVCLWGREYII